MRAYTTSSLQPIGRVRVFALAILRGPRAADPIQSANLLQPRIHCSSSPTSTAPSSPNRAGGAARGAAARERGAVALVAEVSACQPHWHRSQPIPCHLFRGALGEGPRRWPRGGEPERLAAALCSGLRMLVTPIRTTRFSPVHALDLLIEKPAGAHDAIDDPAGGSPPPTSHPMHPIYRSRPGGCAKWPACVLFAVVISAILLSLGGWPFRIARPCGLVGLTVAFSAQYPEPRRAFAANIVIVIGRSRRCWPGVTEFLILDGVDPVFRFWRFGMAPTVLAAALLSRSANQRLASIALPGGSYFLRRDPLAPPKSAGL